MQEPVIVIFRKWHRKADGNGVIALFPEISHHDRMCSSYEHVGQHGAADYQCVIARTVPAKMSEYASLYCELTGEPYNYVLNVRKRRPGPKYS